MKKFSAVILAFVLVFAMVIPAFATDDGSITISNAKPSTTYNAYEILTLESYNADTGAYAYKAASTAWSTFINSSDIKDVYVSVDSDGYVTWVQDAEGNNADAAAFAKLALAYAKNNSITATATDTTSATETEASMTGLNLGYYLVDSSLGALCSLNTAAKDAEILEKNDVPSVVKKIVEGADLVDTNTASIGDTINYQVTVTAQPGAENYVLHDTIDSTLELDTTSITASSGTGTYTVNTAPDDGHSFDVTFTKAYLDTITTANTTITVTYSATLKDNAVIAGTGNNNKVVLTYGDNNTTEESKVTTYTYKVDVVKTDNSNTIIEGAEFRLYDAAEGGNEIILKQDASGNYIVDTTAGATGVVITAGTATIAGLANGTYYLEETKAPDGYNELDARKAFTINNANLEAVTASTTYTSGGVQVINQTGSILPSTGGIGTTIFYIAGAVLVLAAVAYVFSRKRHSVTEG